MFLFFFYKLFLTYNKVSVNFLSERMCHFFSIFLLFNILANPMVGPNPVGVRSGHDNRWDVKLLRGLNLGSSINLADHNH